MAGAELAVAQRQVLVAADALVEDLDVPRAVHGLDREVALLRLRGEHVVLVVLPVAAPLPERAVEDLRAAHLLVAVVLVHAAHVLLHLLPDHPALRVPEDHPGGLVLQVEEVERRAEAAVVALFRLLEHVQVGLLVLLLRPGRAVDALEHLVPVVAAPVGARDLHELEDLELAGGGDVGPAAQVDEVALAVEADVLVRRDGLDDLRLVLLADRLEELHGVVALPHLARDRDVALRELAHALLDRREVLGREGALVAEVVVEAVLDHRADGDLRFGEELLHRVGEQVRRRVADEVEPLRVPVGDDGERRVALDPERRVHQRAVHLAGERGLGEAGADRGRHLGDRDRLVE